MSTQGLSVPVVFALALGLCGGCAGVPPVPTDAQSPPPAARSTSGSGYCDDDEGWLFDRLTGRDRSASSQNAPSGVIPASATEPAAKPPAPASPATAAAAAPKGDDGDSGFDASKLKPKSIYSSIKKAFGYGPNEAKAKAALKEGEVVFRQAAELLRRQQHAEATAKFEEAAAKFKTAAARSPDSPLEEDALFLLGESRFFSDQYSKSHDTYGELLKKYDNTRSLDTAMAREFAIGRLWEEQYAKHPRPPIVPNLTDKTQPTFDTFGNALDAYARIRQYDPIGPLADDAVMATANAYFRKKRFEEAAFHYDLIRKEYPKSEHQAKAHILGLQSKLRVYQGPRYDGKPLSDASEIAAQTLTQFRGELGEEESRMLQARQRITELKAARDLAMAEYYDKKRCYGAARFYYQDLIRRYPLTPQARRAQARLEEISGRPDVPPNRFKWLSDLFPSEE